MPATVYTRVLRRSIMLVLTASPLFAFCQARSNNSIRDVEVCQILNDPNAFDGQMVRFRGRLEFEFEDDHVDDSACGLPLLHTEIWWDYGGDPMAALQAEAKQIQALTSPVLKDAQFDEFRLRTRAHRPRRPDGEECHSRQECAYYDVVATYTGRFFAGRVKPGRTLPGGFGHMGCCHLFVIEQVSEVVVQKTSVPDEDLQFSCASTTWRSEYPSIPTPNLDARLAANKKFMIGEVHTHGDDSLIETIESGSPWHYLGLTGYLALSSPDLLTTYTAQFPQSPHSKKAKKHEPTAPAAPIVMSVSEERCEPTTN